MEQERYRFLFKQFPTFSVSNFQSLRSPESVELQAAMSAEDPLPDKKVYDGWKIKKQLGKGANGVVYAVEREDGDVRKGVLKLGLSTEGAKMLSYEQVVMEALVSPTLMEQRTQHVVRVVAGGTTKYKVEGKEQSLPYVIMESLPDNCIGKIGEVADSSAQCNMICDYAMQFLKGIYDMHTTGFIHRDIKPENMGMANGELGVIYDMGMCRYILDEEGELRLLRSYSGMRGTEEWSSLNAENGCDQGRVDDLWGWIYLVNEFVNAGSKNPQAWTAFEGNMNYRMFLKSYKFPARIILANCPHSLFKAMMYIRLLAPTDTPNYFYIASLMLDAKREVKRCQRGAANDVHGLIAEIKYMDNLFF